MKKYLSLFLVAITFSIIINAEEILRGSEANAIIKNSEVIRYKDGMVIPSFVRMANDKGPSQAELNTWISVNYVGDENFQSKFVSASEDDLGFTHIKLQQVVSGVPVEMAVLRAHFKNGKLHSINGSALSNPISPSYVLSESQSLTSALNKINAKSYKWEIAVEEEFIKKTTGNPEATFYPKGEQVYFPTTMRFESNDLVPCYKFDIYAQEPLYRANVYVSAINGEILFEDHTIKHVDSAGTAVTSFSGSQNIISDYNNGSFRLRESGRGKGVETWDMLNGTNYGNATDLTNPTNSWPDTLRLRYATDAHWGAEMVYDYYLTNHNRNSIDGNGFKLRSYVHYDVNYNNAFWNGQYMTYGDGSGSALPYTTVDICGHEVSHGLTSRTAGLVYAYESGALNESFSDIFGCAVEIFAKPHPTNNWLMGEDRGNHIRNMGNPKQKGDPDTYQGANWAVGTADNGGVHTNSGVQNHWFYLLTLGGSGSNDNNDTYNVTGIGIAKSEAIAFRNLTVYLGQNSEYNDARFFAIESAMDLYGPCSPELESTVNAWYAVGVGPAYLPGVVSDFSPSRTSICVIPAEVDFSNLSNYNSQTYVWDFGDGNSSTQKNPIHVYRTPGSYTVKLTANSATCGMDIETKTNLIVINPPPSAATSDVISCEGYPAKLTATGTGDLHWFDDTLGGTPIYVGSPFVTSTLNSNETYYVQNVLPSTNKKVGPDTIVGFGQYFNGDQHLVFDVYDYITLKSVKVFANGKKGRTIELRDSTGTVLKSKSVLVDHGTQVVSLDFDLVPGNDYQLGVSSGSNPDFYRYSSGVNFPYTLNGVASITKSSANTNPTGYYYFFFDWVVKAQDCSSALTAVNVTMDNDPGCLPFWSGLEEVDDSFDFDLYPNPTSNNFNLSFNLKKDQELRAEMLDVRGQRVKEIANTKMTAGQHTLNISTDDVENGLYLIRLVTDNEVAIKNLMIVE